jgi:SAM-dependent methyltransferase
MADDRSALPSPEKVIDAFQAFHRTAAVKAGVELDLFTAIGEGVDTLPALATRCQAAERGIRILCDYLVVIGFLRKAGSRYALGLDAATFLDRHSPAYFGSTVNYFACELNQGAFAGLTAAVRRGGTALPGDGVLAPEHPVWVEFARAMAPIGAFLSMLLARFLGAGIGGRMKVLDIAAGHGLYGIALLRENPQAEVVALDWPKVLTVAQENAETAGVADRFHAMPGSALTTEFGEGYDLVLLVHFLHLDPAACERLLTKVHAALIPGGRAVVLGLIPNEDRVSPPTAGAFNLVMLATTGGGDSYPFSNLDRMFRNAGFDRTELHDLPPSPERIVIAYR